MLLASPTQTTKRRIPMKRIFSALLTLAAAAALVPVVHAQCTNATLTGKYGATFSGFLAPGHSTKGDEKPFAGAGLATFDGAGSMSATLSVSFDGVIVTNDLYTASYTVNSDCTGSMTSTNGGANFTFVIVNSGAELLAVDIDAGQTWTLDGKKL
jgi:hypothetical protein